VFHFEGGALVPLGEAIGGQGWPFGCIPGVAEFPCPFAVVDGDDPEFDDPEFEDPVFDVEPLAAPGVPGNVPHGDPLGVVPGLVEVFGFTVEGCVVFQGVGGLVEFEPGTVDGVFGVVLVGGFVGFVGGIVEPVGGVVVPGVWACPGV